MKNPQPEASIPTQSIDAPSRPVRVDSAGRIFEMSGDPLVMDGLEPEAILEGLADIEAGRMVPLVQIIAERK
jgi:hypothetical protein